MRAANAQTLPHIIVVDDLSMPSLPCIPEEEEAACEEEAEEAGYFLCNGDEQEWRDDYYASIRL